MSLDGLERCIRRFENVSKIVHPQKGSAFRKEILDTLTEIGVTNLEQEYSRITENDTSMNPIPQVLVDKRKDYAIINAVGKGVAYIEFGTGSVGRKTANHATRLNKEKVGAKPYNSGSTIHFRRVPVRASVGGKYVYARRLIWIKPEEAITPNELNSISGVSPNDYEMQKYNLRITQGIKAGMQIYRTARVIERNMPKYVRQKIRKML